ncbi:MAG: sulfotransferase [Vicinamibacterales bacterium]
MAKVTEGLRREAAGRVLGRAIEPFTGRAELWARHNVRCRTLLPFDKAIEAMNRRWQLAPSEDDHRPIFVLSAGWRSGSTLVQRLLVSKAGALIWGEPFTMADYIGRLADSLCMFSEESPPPQFFLSFHDVENVAAIQEKWIAHLYPEPVHLRDAHRAFFLALLAAPAAERGFPRWGLKDCKYGIDHALYLKWLFPKARFFFVYRNPYHAWRSFRLFGGYTRWPDQPVFTARQFGEMWASLVQGFLARHADVDGMPIKFEDLVAGKVSVEMVSTFAGVECDAGVLSQNVSGRGKRELVPLPRLEKSQLARAVEPIAGQLGYTSADA